MIIAALLAVAAAAPSSYPTKYSDIVITSQTDVRNLDHSGQWRLVSSSGRIPFFHGLIHVAFSIVVTVILVLMEPLAMNPTPRRE